MKEKERFKNEFFLYESDPEKWQLNKYGANHRSKGDCIAVTMAIVMDDWLNSYSLTEERMDWNLKAINACADLLIWGKRWPDGLNMPMDAKTWIGWKLSRIPYKLGLSHEKYRPQHIMTRDPYNNTLAACAIYGLDDHIKVISIPWYLYRPTTWAWHRYLKNPSSKTLKRWRKLEKLNNPKKEFAQDLKRRRHQALYNFW